MRTLTHEPLALAAALIITIAFVAGLTVQVALRIQTRSGRARPSGAGTEQADDPLGATGPGVVSMRRATPGPDTKSRPSATGECRSAGSANGSSSARSAKAKGSGSPEAADTAPEGAPAALSGATLRGCVYCGAELPDPRPWPHLHEEWCPRATPPVDPIAQHIDTAAALLIADDWKPTDRLDVGTEAEWWLAIGAPEGWAPPPVVPGRSES